MKSALTCLVIVSLIGIALSSSRSGVSKSAATSAPARLVRASIQFKGETILTGSTSDNGRADADVVWDYLKNVEFKPTESFEQLGIAPQDEEFALKGEEIGNAGRVVELKIAYGGTASLRTLTLTRIPKDRQGREWRLDAAEVDAAFNRRLISRELASRLSDPKDLRR